MSKMKTGVSYFARAGFEHMEEDMDQIRRNHCNFVVHTFSETDLEFYKGTLKRLIEISHNKNLEVWLDPWGLGGVFGGESYSKFASCNLDSRQISSKGDSLPAACFNSSKFRKFMKEWVDVAIQIGADNIFWDEPHFYIYKENIDEKTGSERWTCRCQWCRDLFKAKYGYELPLQMNADLQEFKEASIVDFIKEMCEYTKLKRVKNSFCFLPCQGPIGGVRNWEVFAKIEALDIIGTDPYWPVDKTITEEDVRKKVSLFSKRIKNLCDKFDKEGQIWILNFNIKAGTEEYIKVAVDAAYSEGIRNLAAWSYYGTEMMDSLSCDNSHLVWETLGEAYHKITK